MVSYETILKATANVLVTNESIQSDNTRSLEPNTPGGAAVYEGHEKYNLTDFADVTNTSGLFSIAQVFVTITTYDGQN